MDDPPQSTPLPPRTPMPTFDDEVVKKAIEADREERATRHAELVAASDANRAGGYRETPNPFLKFPAGDDGGIDKREAAATHPFKVTAAGSNKVKIQGGSFAGHNISTATLTVSGSSVEFVVLKPVYTLSIDNDFVYTSTFSSLAFDKASSGSETTVTSDSGSDFCLPLAELHSGAVVNQIIMNSIVAKITDDGSGTGKALLTYFG